MFYFARSLDFNSLYFQFFKLGKDLTYFIEFWYITLILIFLYIRYLRINYAKKKLYTLELYDRKLINEQPIVTLFEGPMGSGKTQLMTDMALSQDVIFRDKALDIMFSCDLKFPNFEWKRIERMIDYCLHKKILYNLASIDAVMNEITYIFEKSRLTHIYDSIFHRRLKRRYKINTVNFLFDYDYSTYSLYYFNGLYDEYIWDVIKTYAKSYYIYSMSSALLTANYSIRTSNELKKNGKFPLWIDGLFEKYTKKNSMFAHIMDFDSFRLGKKMKKNNNNLAEFGVYAFTEIGKERGNKNELTNVKKGDDEVNQKNDLFNSYIKMIRHLCTIDFYPFAKVFLDEQRNQSLGADARELGDIIRIENKTNKSVLKPNFINKYNYVKNIEKIKDYYYDNKHGTDCKSLFMYFVKKISTLLYVYIKRNDLQWSYKVYNISTRAGTLDSEKVSFKYYMINRKILNNRYSTDCHSSFFYDRNLRFRKGLNDLPTYKNVTASVEELKSQNSYFIQDLYGKPTEDINE